MSEAKKSCGFRTSIGGQALIEGVMMRGKYNWAVAVREPSGDIYLEEHDLASGKAKNAPDYRGELRKFIEENGLDKNAIVAACNLSNKSPCKKKVVSKCRKLMAFRSHISCSFGGNSSSPSQNCSSTGKKWVTGMRQVISAPAILFS